MRHVLFQNLQFHGPQRRARGLNLGEDVAAIFALLDHSLHPLNLAGNTPQAGLNVIVGGMFQLFFHTPQYTP